MTQACFSPSHLNKLALYFGKKGSDCELENLEIEEKKNPINEDKNIIFYQGYN